MPDWSYNTIFKPVLFQMPASSARRAVFNSMRTVACLPFGRQLFLYMANEIPEPTVACSLADLNFISPVSCGAGLNTPGSMLDIFDTFGFGMIELGPVTLTKLGDDTVLKRLPERFSIQDMDVPVNKGLSDFIAGLPPKAPSVPLFVRVAFLPNSSLTEAREQLSKIVGSLPSWVATVSLDTRWLPTAENLSEEYQSFFVYARQVIGARSYKSILTVSPGASEDEIIALCRSALTAQFDGICITGGVVRDGKRLYGADTRDASMQALAIVRAIAPKLFVIASGGIIEPSDAIKYFKLGADMVQLHSGLVYSGPGLPKRINELQAYSSDLDARSRHSFDSEPSAPPKNYSSPYSLNAIFKAGGWLGFACMGAGMVISCSSAITVGLTSVILPYDEKFLGMTRDAMIHMNDNLLPFMSHDRVTYAGSSISCGLLFIALAFFGARLGQRWAYNACLYSTSFGFLSFLLFLGFHYLDPLHMLITFILLPFFLWAFLAKPKFVLMRASNQHNTVAWRNSLIGQLLFVGIGVGLLLAGATICYVGTHTVFVNEDLMFMHTTAQDLLSHNHHLLPAIAHDRAGFGATLVTAGIAVLGTALHGFRQGEGWVWWMLLISGLPGFVSTLAIHYHIGYTSLVHLLPAYIASLMFVFGLIFSYKYLCVEPSPSINQ